MKVVAAVVAGVMATAVVALPATGAVNPVPIAKKALRAAKKADSRSKDTRHDIEVLTEDNRKLKGEVSDRMADAERAVQVVDGKVASHTHKVTTHSHDTSGEIAQDTKGSITAPCQPGESVTGGGYEFDTNQGITIPQPSVTAQQPDGQGWKVTVNNLGGGTTVQLKVIAVCVP